MRLEDIMTEGVVTIGPDDPVGLARERMRIEQIRHLVVVDGSRTVGILSERDIGGPRASARARARLDGRPVRDFMATEIVAASPRTTLRQAANLMRGRTIGCLLVVQDEAVVGLVTTTDLLDELGRGTARPTGRVEKPPVRRPPSTGTVQGHRALRGPTGPRGARRLPPERTRRTVPPSAPRIAKRGVEEPPVHVRVVGAILSPEDREMVRTKLTRRLTKFASAIERVSVRIADVNGPKGGVDHRCVIKVVLRGLPSVVVERTDAALQLAVDAAVRATGMSVHRAIRRRRLKPLHHRKSTAAEAGVE